MVTVNSAASSYKNRYPGKFEGRFEGRMRQLIKAKLKGVELEPEHIPEAPNVINLMDALKRSLGSGGRKSASGSATVHKLPARKKNIKDTITKRKRVSGNRAR